MLKLGYPKGDKRLMVPTLGVIAFGVGIVTCPVSVAQKKSIDFVQDVQPILKAHCVQCHGSEKRSGGLDVRSREALIKGGVSGPSVIPGKSKDSLLLNRILGHGEGERMPLGFAPLDDSKTATIKDWIDQGARSGSGVPARVHWAFVAPVQTPFPKVLDSKWVRNPIDSYVLARLEQEGLRPSPRADKTTLLRRLTLDLTGLPPTPQDVDAFHADHTANAYEKVVDRLLASPHFGERMALPWLDAARYADSNGFQQDGDNYQYVWRDWVVNAINRDMPFDEFTIQQLAGDLLTNPTTDQLVATAFNRNHMLNGEGGAIPEEQRNVVLFDRVDVTSTTWMALTMACARCHDHKYDPVTQREYFSLMAYFNNVPESGVPPGGGQYRIADPWIYAGTSAQNSRLVDLETNVAKSQRRVEEIVASPETKAALSTWADQTRLDIREARNAKVKISPWILVKTFSYESFDRAFTSEPTSNGGQTPVEHPEYVDGKVHVLSGDNTTFTFERKISIDRASVWLLSFGSDDGIKVWLNDELLLAKQVTRAAILDSELIRVKLSPGENRLKLKIINGGGIGGFVFRALPGGQTETVAAALMSPEQGKEVETAFLEQQAPQGYQEASTRFAIDRRALDDLKSTLPQVMVMSDAQPRKTHVFSRGDYESPLEEVAPNTPAVLPPLPKIAPSNRLDLARWLVARDNPLTARVAVNRYWQMLFGQGIVKTSENFGVQGEPPSHPELLDWLAVDFREGGWKVKRLIKTIVMSATYRQSSKVTPELLRRDQDNRLLARGARFRMPSPFLRDIALASSGLMNPAIGGKPVYPYQPPGIWDGLAITKERDFTYPQSTGSDLYRRSLYTFWRRTAAPGNMFDTSSRQACTVRASLTSTPLHALTTLNDVTWVEAARVLAQNVMKGCCPANQFSEAFRRVCARRPSAVENKILKASYERSLKSFQADPKHAREFLAVGETPVDPQLDSARLAAFASVCLAIYNLDEALTRE